MLKLFLNNAQNVMESLKSVKIISHYRAFAPGGRGLKMKSAKNVKCELFALYYL